ncbi:dTDP-4-dehydrorhamnose 3,5-epimerase [bacterium]|nr:dTDP-4-dehydrorhamnose 3,5-epimerase [bacterium]
MKFFQVPLAGAYMIELEPFEDDRGSFARLFCAQEFRRIGFYKSIVQINHSCTRSAGTVRGLHYQCPPASESKIIRCIRGKVYDVMVDIREGSPTFLRSYGLALSPENLRMVFIPEGFAHGFQALADDAELLYHHSAAYDATAEAGLRPDDPALGLHWPQPVRFLSPRDCRHPLIDGSFTGVRL